MLNARVANNEPGFQLLLDFTMRMSEFAHEMMHFSNALLHIEAKTQAYTILHLLYYRLNFFAIVQLFICFVCAGLICCRYLCKVFWGMFTEPLA